MSALPELGPLPSSSSSPISNSATRNTNRVPILIYTFITLHLLGSLIFVIVLILTSFSPSSLYGRYRRRRQRPPHVSPSEITLINTDSRPKTTPNTAWKSFCISWIVFGLSYATGTLVSIGYGHGIKGIDRIAEDEGGPRAMCMIQAGLIYAAPLLVGHTTVALLVQLRSVMLFGMGRSTKMMSSFTRKAIVVVPWVLWLVNLTVVLIFTLGNPSLLEMNGAGTYCHLKLSMISRIGASWLAVLCLIAIGIESYLVILMYKQGFRLAGQCDASRTAMRLGIFMLQAVAMVGLALVFIFVHNRGAPTDIIIAAQTPFAGILFGLRTRLLCCSKRRKEEELIKILGHTNSSTSSSPTTTSNHSRQHCDDLV